MKYISFIVLAIFISSCAAIPYPSGSFSLSQPLLLDKRNENKEADIRSFVKPEDVKDHLKNISPSLTNDMFSLRLITQHIRALPKRDEKKDFWNYPKETILRGGDCEDKTHLLVSLAIAAGFEDVYAVKGYYQKNSIYKRIGHVWTEITIDGTTYIIESLSEKPAFVKKIKSTGYFPYFKYNNKESYEFKR